MKRADSNLLKKLSKYSKKDIIEGLGRQYNADYIISGILNDLEHRATENVFADHQKALNDEIVAREAYIKWRNEMCAKYGDGKRVKLANIPSVEISKGVALEKALKDATETEQRLNKKIEKIIGVEV